MTTYLITGANRGIGYEMAKQAKEAGAEVIAACRQTTQELDQLGVQVETGLDVGSDKAVTNFAQRLEGKTIDILVNNAGIWSGNRLGNLDFEKLLHLFNINSLGALRVTQALLPNLKSGSKIALITSRMGSIGDNNSGNSYGYRMSKVALSMAGKSLAIDLQPKGIAVAILHPGLVSTRMTNFTTNGISTAEAASGLLKRIEQLNLNNSGTFWHAKGEVLPW
ncbi:MAG: SDR family oxidoreductase [Okeania sp. SIO2D1]|nr:SDR family oxidoreductase [Okeania sp. SIO2D1]